MSWLQKFLSLEESCNKKLKKESRKPPTELDSLTLKANDLEEKCSLKDNQIKALEEEQLATTEKKLQASQEEVFVDISQLVPSALDGYKGQENLYNDGKAWTSRGEGLDTSLIRANISNKTVSMLEIYNERIRDLISTTTRMENGTPGKQYTIKHDANGNTQVSDLKVVDVHSAKEVAFLLNQPANSRTQKLRHPYLQEHSKGGNATQKARLRLRGGGGSSRSTSASSTSRRETKRQGGSGMEFTAG
ncbi:hypothetical protein JHK86_027597 [Glycine max]|nr:hypothetical protein JHK86_027597 [Glycine max]